MPCEFPYLIKNPSPFMGDGFATLPVPCGKCYDCRMRNASQWALRLRSEERISTSALFVTLTYDTEFVPITQKGYMTLKLKDVQDFFKRLRKDHPIGHKLKYFLVGEYGTQRDRPHYHILLYNCNSEYIGPNWIAGGTHIGTVSGASIAYCLKYMMKEGKIPKHKNDDRKPEFRTMSKGLGSSYLTYEMVSFHKENIERLYATIEDGIKIPLPRYYRERIWDELERVQQNIVLHKKFEEQKLHDKTTIEERRRGAEVRTKRAQKDAQKRTID